MPQWLAERMTRLGTAITENIILDYGRGAFLSRLSDPFWFQALGAVMGMDWHSSGITTSVMGALKRGLASRAPELGIYICGGRGRFSRNTPNELRQLAGKHGFDGEALVRTSRLTARIDNNAIADGFQIYLHSFVVAADGEWAVVQQGLNNYSGMARRYHWHSASVTDFVSDPHTGIVGEHLGLIMNLVDPQAPPVQLAMLEIAREHPERILREASGMGILPMSVRNGDHGESLFAAEHGRDTRATFARYLRMPTHHEVRSNNLDLKRLGAVLAVAYERDLHDFAELLLLEKLGPRTLQSLALVAEVIHGTPNRFDDPARFSFAHGGKDGHPFKVPLKTYDTSLDFLRKSLDRARVGDREKLDGFRRLDHFVRQVETRLAPEAEFEALITHEKAISPALNGRSVMDDKRGRHFNDGKDRQQTLF